MGIFLLTTSVSGHAIGRATYCSKKPMRPADTLDESGHLEARPGSEESVSED